MAPQLLLRDLIEIPDRVHAGDYVLTLSKGVEQDSTIRDYVVTKQLEGCFDEALGLIQSAVEGRTSLGAYLDGSFGSGKSHFMAMLHAILSGNPEARGKKGLVEVVAKHDAWLRGRRFLLVPYHMPDSTSLDSAILGGYVDHVRKLHPDKPLPAVYRDEGLLADARELRGTLGDEAFIAGLLTDSEWSERNWDSGSLDKALSAPPGDRDRMQLVGELLTTHFKRYAQAVSGTAESFIELDKGLAEISRHAKNVLGYDAVVLLLDELVLWLSSYIGNPERIKEEAQKVSKLVESAEHERPAPIISLIPRQRDLRDLVSRDTAGATTASLFDTLKYWDGRFDHIKLEDRNLPVIVQARLLRPKSPEAQAELDAAFVRTNAIHPEVWEALIDAQGGAGDRDAFRATYPFSPAFLHAMVDISGALQRQRTALKLMQELLVAYRDLLPVGQLMPLGAIYDVLAGGSDKPFTDKLRDEFEQAKTFYTRRLRPYLLAKHRLTEEQARELPSRHAFRADDLVVKTLLLAALVPNVPALRNLTASHLAALNHGSIATMIPGQDRAVVAKTLRELAGEFGEIRVSGTDDPSVEVALIGVDTAAILQQVRHVDDDAAKRSLLKSLLWEEFGVTARQGEFVSTRLIFWKGTERTVELVFANVRDRDVADGQFKPELPGALRVVVDYPFDTATHSPNEDRSRVWKLQEQLPQELTLVWLPSFLSPERMGELGDLVVISHILELPSRLDDLTPHLTSEDRYHARTQLESRKAALTTKLRDALKRAYGLLGPDDADLGARAEEHVLALDSRLDIRPPAGLALGDALQRICGQLLDHAYPKHPDFDPEGRRQVFKKTELTTVFRAVEQAAQNKVGRLEVPRTDLPVLRRIANPLGIATVGEVFVLRDEWKLLIDRAAARSGRATGELRVGDIRSWINEEQPGLPELIVDLLVVCYAAQTDRAWMRAGQPIPPPEMGRLAPDMTLRMVDLPTEEEFREAGHRAVHIFGLGRQPVRTARAVQALADGVRDRARVLLSLAERLQRQLEAHAGTLDLDDRSPRLATARTVAGLLNELTGLSGDATALVGALAGYELPREGEIYKASLDHADELTATLTEMRWPILDRLPTLADSSEAKAGQARAILDRLRAAARHDEHDKALGPVLREAEQNAINLIIERPPPPPPLPPPPPPPPPPPELVVRQAAAAQVPRVIEELRAQALAEPDATFEITWRIVDEP
ncbi:MAG TPA: phage resistance protein [Streptosporangiaceae bacterium]|nr:phage resistance protein [Streptosporangiaceae bacterium]